MTIPTSAIGKVLHHCVVIGEDVIVIGVQLKWPQVMMSVGMEYVAGLDGKKSAVDSVNEVGEHLL